MKGIIQHGFGSPVEALEFGEVDKPSVKDSGVLVRVGAASIHIGDVYGVRGFPKVMRPMFRTMNAKSGVIGTDIAGTVEAVGKDTTTFKPGDEVFGWCKGAFAEYASTTEDALTLRPSNLSQEQAAALGVSAFTALQALRDHGSLHAEQKVLITGASGGVGTFAVQIAKSFGAEVTGVCSTRNIEMVRSLGADNVIDYTQQDFTQGGPEYDLILDNIGGRSLKDTRQALTPSGILLSNGSGAPTGWFGGLGLPLRSSVTSIFVGQQGRAFLSLPNKEDLATLKDLAATGEITPVMDRTYALDQGIEAISHVGEGHAQGTTVITMDQPTDT